VTPKRPLIFFLSFEAELPDLTLKNVGNERAIPNLYISHVYQFKTYFAKHRVMGQSWLRANSYRIHVTTASTDKGTAPVRHHIKWAVPNHEIFPQKTEIK
jgi:hypothetical protein